MKLKILIILYFVFVEITSAQLYTSSFYEDCNIDTNSINSLNFRIENSNFFKNNEYFNYIVEGYTLTGWLLTPKLIYYPFKNTKIETGFHFLKYSGIEKFTKAIPTLRLQYQASKSIDIIIGNIYGSTNHKIIEPIFKYEYYFTDNIENGLQFLFDKKKYKGDIWINWQQFIFKGDDAQEIFTLGLSNKFIINPLNNKHKFHIPIQSIFLHKGGQINETNKSLLTHNNSAFGIGYSFFLDRTLIDKITTEHFYVIFNDMSTTKQYAYTQGYGLYSKLNFHIKNINLNLSWWYSDSYISKRGHPIYQSHSTIYTHYNEKNRALISCKMNYEKNIINGLDIGAGFETYFDLYSYYVDYWYMIYINFNKDFFIRKI